MTALTLALAYAAFVALYLGVARHFHDVFDAAPTPNQRRGLRALGSACLVAAFAAAIGAAGWQVGPVLWCAALSVAATALVFLLPYARRALLALPFLLLPLGGLFALF